MSQAPRLDKLIGTTTIPEQIDRGDAHHINVDRELLPSAYVETIHTVNIMPGCKFESRHYRIPLFMIGIAVCGSLRIQLTLNKAAGYFIPYFCMIPLIENPSIE